jgi:hypothetical protein
MNNKTSPRATKAPANTRPARKAVSKPEEVVSQQVQQAPQETFYVQNPYPGIHHLSDIDMTFGPFEAKNLLWEKADLVTKSYDLAKALNSGSLVRISQEQYENILNEERDIEQYELSRRIRGQQTVGVDVDGRRVNAEAINVNIESPNNRQPMSIAGDANDPKTYATAYQVYTRMCTATGELPSARAFNDKIEKNPRFLAGLLEQIGFVSESEGQTSGQSGRGRATVATVPDSIGSGGTAQVKMSNFQRDQYVAGGQQTRSNSFDYEVPMGDDNIDLLPDAEEIDLLLD